MADYRLNIDKFKELNEERGYKLKSVVSLQYPIYYLHAEIIDTNPHIMHGLDKVILKSFKVYQNFDEFKISKLLSIPENVVRRRKEYFHKNQIIDNDNNITNYGFQYMESEEEQIEHRVTHDLLLDGISLKPLPKEFYRSKYKQEYIFDGDYNHFTNDDGETVSKNPFSPDVVHLPIQRSIVVENIKNVQSSERVNYNIPVGLKDLESFSYRICTLPIFIGLFEKKGDLKREFINGFEVDGSDENLGIFRQNLVDRISNMELRLNEIKKGNDNSKFIFESNWKEIDLKREDDRLFFFSREDLKNYFNNDYQFVPRKKAWKEELTSENVFFTDFSLGIIVTREVFFNSNCKKELLGNLKRGRDYLLRRNVTSGVWLVFFEFIVGDDFVKNAIEVSLLVDRLKGDLLPRNKIINKITEFDHFRDILAALQEFRLLEEIDIDNHMLKIPNGK